jgi:electron transport complex protein RnfD
MSLVGGPGSPLTGLLLGFRPGSIGEISVVMVALGAAMLVARRIVTLTIPVAVIAGVVLSTAWSGAAMLHLASGGLWLGAFFMATDYVTSPNTRPGQIVFGLVIGGLTGAIRMFGGYPEGICYAILIANALVPALNVWFRPRRVALAGAPS